MIFHTWRLTLKSHILCFIQATGSPAYQTLNLCKTGDQSNITSLIIPAPCNFSNDYSANQNNCVKMIPGMMNWFDNNFEKSHSKADKELGSSQGTGPELIHSCVS